MRAAAEARLSQSPPVPVAATAAELLHELQVHRVELEMQNEALREARDALDKSQQRFMDFHEFAPVAFLTLTDRGLIDAVNITGTDLLGVARSALLQNPFARYVTPEDADRWHLYFVRVLTLEDKADCELTLQREDGTSVQVRVDGLALRKVGEPTTVRMTLIDISERKQAEAAARKNEAFKTAILDAVSAQIAVLDHDGLIVAVNGAWRNAALEYAAESKKSAIHTQVGVNYLAICQAGIGDSAEGAHSVYDGIRAVLDGSLASFSLEYPCHSPCEPRWFSMNVTPLGNGAVITHTDITQRKRAEDDLRIAAVAFDSQNGMMITDPRGVILRINAAFTRLTGYSAIEAIGQTPALLSSGRHEPMFYQRMWTTLKEKGYWQGEVWNKRKNGLIYAEMLNVTAVCTPERGVTHYVGSFTDITEDKEAEAEIHRLAYYDPLTHLPNRRLLQDRLGQAVAATARSGLYGALFFIDLDHFKVLNDTRGHDVGDSLLIDVAQRFRAAMREGDTVARLGGDEFVVVMEDLGSEINAAAALALHLGEKLRRNMDSPFLLLDVEYHCKLSIGVSLFYKQEKVEDLLKHADLALYQAKNSGRNTLRFFDPTMQAALDQRSALEVDLHQAIDKAQLRLYYQPQVDATRRVIGVEALLRWQHPERGLLPPDEFIPLAEDTGLILPIGLWVLETACAQLKDWEDQESTRDLIVAVNVSARQFRQPDFVAQVARALETSGATPTRLKLELTESLVLDDVTDTIAKMHAIKQLGVRFSMDDFGTGYSSLSYLARLPLDQLKIDRSFVSNLPGNNNDETIARTIITLGRELAMDVIAEGVETEAQLAFLELHGCHAYQGYLFSRPLPLQAFEAFVGRI